MRNKAAKGAERKCLSAPFAYRPSFCKSPINFFMAGVILLLESSGTLFPGAICGLEHLLEGRSDRCLRRHGKRSAAYIVSYGTGSDEPGYSPLADILRRFGAGTACLHAMKSGEAGPSAVHGTGVTFCVLLMVYENSKKRSIMI